MSLPPKPRDTFRDPRSGSCALHLRRICGTCTHFPGALRGTGQHLCPVMAQMCSARTSAAQCELWQRRSA